MGNISIFFSVHKIKLIDNGLESFVSYDFNGHSIVSCRRKVLIGGAGRLNPVLRETPRAIHYCLLLDTFDSLFAISIFIPFLSFDMAMEILVFKCINYQIINFV